ncbi:recombinase family protein [Akkermansia biwaensis]
MKKIPVALFVRVSTNGQNNERQIRDLSKVAEERDWQIVEIIEEKISGATKSEERKGVQRLLALAKEGKIKKVLVTEISRLGRNTYQAISVVKELEKRQVSLYWQNQNMETLLENGKRNPAASLVFVILSDLAETERETMLERINSGIQAAKAKGIHCGRPKGSHESQEAFLSKYAKVIKDLEDGISVRKVMKIHEVSNFTVMKIRKTLSLQHEKGAKGTLRISK